MTCPRVTGMLRRVAQAMGAAEDVFPVLDAVPDDAAPAVLTRRRECGDRTLEAVEDVLRAGHFHRE